MCLYVFICVYMCLYVFICVYKTTFFPLSSGVPPSKTCGFSTAALACLAKSPRCGIAQLRPWPVIVHRPSFSRGAKEPGCMGLSQQNFINWLVVTGTFFIYPYIGNNHPNWLSYFFKMVKATNQINYVFFFPTKSWIWLAQHFGFYQLAHVAFHEHRHFTGVLFSSTPNVLWWKSRFKPFPVFKWDDPSNA